MAREVDLLAYLLPILQEVKELQTIASIENPVLEDVWELVESVLNNQFILTADERGITRHEKMLQMHSGAAETLETRRFKVLARYQEQAPYTNIVVQQLLDTLLGEGRYTYERNAAEKWVKVRLELTIKGQFDAVEMMLERITPQNMLLHITLRYNQHSTLARYTHAQLAAFTHKQLREDVLP